jgi:hypothetical protein
LIDKSVVGALAGESFDVDRRRAVGYGGGGGHMSGNTAHDEGRRLGPYAVLRLATRDPVGDPLLSCLPATADGVLCRRSGTRRGAGPMRSTGSTA